MQKYVTANALQQRHTCRGHKSSVTRSRGIFGAIICILVLIFAASFTPRLEAAEIDYQSLQENPVETAFRRILTQEVPDWGDGGGEVNAELKSIKWPLKLGYVTGLFNLRATKGKRKHSGVDMPAPKGTPIYAALDGVVEVVSNGGKGWRGYGQVVFVNHGNKFWSLYSHCNTVRVKIGQKVKQGDVIATVGRTGRATCDHLHFELRDSSGMPMDPMKFLPKEGALLSRKP